LQWDILKKGRLWQKSKKFRMYFFRQSYKKPDLERDNFFSWCGVKSVTFTYYIMFCMAWL